MLSKLLQPHVVSSTLQHNDYCTHVERDTNLFVKEFLEKEIVNFTLFNMNFT